MAIRIENKLVTDGQALANRIITLRSQSVIPSFVFRKQVLPTTIEPEYDRNIVAWSGLGNVSESEHPSYDYAPVGHAMVLLLDTLGGAMHDSGMLVMPEQMTATALIEPYDINLQGEERIRRKPNFTLQKTDLLCLMFNDSYKEYYEIVGNTAHSMLANHGMKYVLNQRFDLDYLDAFLEDDIDNVEPYR